MSDYTIVSLEDVENLAPKFQMPDGLDARFAKQDLGCAEGAGAVGIERLAPGMRIPFGHKHAHQEEIYVVAEGSGRVKIEDEVRDVRRWDLVRIGADTMRNWEAGPDGLTLIAFGAPIGPQNDGEIVPDWWSD